MTERAAPMTAKDQAPVNFEPWLDSALADDVWLAIFEQAEAYRSMPDGLECTEALKNAEHKVEVAVGRLIQAVIEVEREACAQIVDPPTSEARSNDAKLAKAVRQMFASEIRSRGKDT